MATAETAEEISKKPEVRQALSETTGPKAGEEKVKAATKDKFWFVTHALLIVGCAVLYYLVGSKLIPVPANTVDLVRRFLRGAVLIVIVLAIAKAISIYAIGRLDDAATRFTLRRIEHLLVALVIAVIVIGVVFVNWYTALISVGIGSVIVGLAVQTPMTSFLGWIYILVRRPYQVGDRIQIEDATGDVIDVSYLDTTLWEFGGKYLSTDHPSGRIIKFPNSKVLSAMVFNYSWPLSPISGMRSNFTLPTTAISSSWRERCRKSPRKKSAKR
jgi:small-conductance mechanosensitive channel